VRALSLQDFQTAVLFFARAMIAGAFCATYAFTPEVYNSNVRASAFGIANTFSRAGGMLAPYVGGELLAHGHKTAALAIFAVLTVAACVASLLMTIETAGRGMGDGYVSGVAVPPVTAEPPVTAPRRAGGFTELQDQ
jgi:MFS family permease